VIRKPIQIHENVPIHLLSGRKQYNTVGTYRAYFLSTISVIIISPYHISVTYKLS